MDISKIKIENALYDLKDAVLRNKVGSANGIATLDANGKVPASQLNMANYVTLNTTQTISGGKTFTAMPYVNASANNYPFIGYKSGDVWWGSIGFSNADIPSFYSPTDATWYRLLTLRNYYSYVVTRDTEQTITGAKTFTSAITGTLNGNASTASTLANINIQQPSEVDGSTVGYELIGQYTFSPAYRAASLHLSVSSRHDGSCDYLINFGCDRKQEEFTRANAQCDIMCFGTVWNSSDVGIYCYCKQSGSNLVFSFFWKNRDYTPAKFKVINGCVGGSATIPFTPSNLAWMTSIDESTYGTLLAEPRRNEARYLRTSRTLWGQSFDGSANVSGAMSGVTDITMSDTLRCTYNNKAKIQLGAVNDRGRLRLYSQDAYTYYTDNNGTTANKFWESDALDGNMRFFTYSGGDSTHASSTKQILFDNAGSIVAQGSLYAGSFTLEGEHQCGVRSKGAGDLYLYANDNAKGLFCNRVGDEQTSNPKSIIRISKDNNSVVFSGTADYANRLTTARTLWGNSFDGSGNVTGKISFSNLSFYDEYGMQLDGEYNATPENYGYIDGVQQRLLGYHEDDSIDYPYMEDITMSGDYDEYLDYWETQTPSNTIVIGSNLQLRNLADGSHKNIICGEINANGFIRAQGSIEGDKIIDTGGYRKYDLTSNITFSPTNSSIDTGNHTTTFIYTNTTNSTKTITINTSSTMKTPTGQSISIDVPAGGYGEISCKNIDGINYVRAM